MSVVNKMLQDLENRQSQSDEISADYQAPPKKQSKLLLVVLLVLATLAIAFALMDTDKMFSITESKKHVVEPKLTARSKPTIKMAKVPDDLALGQKKLQPASEKTNKAVSELVASTAKITPAPIDNLSTQPITSNKLLDDVGVKPVTDTQDQQQLTQNNSESVKAVVPEQTSSFSMTGSSQESKRSSLKQRIAESLNNGSVEVARSLLQQLLDAEPDNIKARKKLASLLFAQGNDAQSKQLLLSGIDLHPTSSDLRLMLARLYMTQNAPTQAMSLLTEIQPDSNQQIEYLAYRAALAQQLKQSQLAKSDYKKLTKIESTNAKWWLGLAIAEDQLGEKDIARQAYKNANSLGPLDAPVSDFIQQRILVLAGEQ
ncbi:tetratricopeptide repeat protein [uncultured Paraglaciecola sp.]|uniref:tetratricopeptide repeat protein n=1 Tax=uncultured Paraglaciecola sp. TaxID=1765024 RepID=UPI00262CF0CD|nr:tetratricopeptide repeat protein [uncultured Paraglaciecola sp.]